MRHRRGRRADAGSANDAGCDHERDDHEDRHDDDGPSSSMGGTLPCHRTEEHGDLPIVLLTR
jgi:hypothetical protein